jgi:hypothetical protein
VPLFGYVCPIRHYQNRLLRYICAHSAFNTVVLLSYHPLCTCLSSLFCFLNDWLFCRSDISAATTASTATFVTAIVFNSAIFAVELTVFTLIRPYFKAIYEPRTYVPQIKCANLIICPQINPLTFFSQETNTASITLYVRMAARSISRRLSRHHISQWSWRVLFRSLPKSHGLHIPSYLVDLLGRPHTRRFCENRCSWKFWFGLFHFRKCRYRQLGLRTVPVTTGLTAGSYG